MKKILSVFLGILLLMTVVGCNRNQSNSDTSASTGASGTTSTSTTLRILTHYDAAFRAAADEYEKETGVKVEIDQASWDTINDTLEVVLSSGSSEYDIIMVDGPNTAAYVERGYLVPLTSYLTDAEVETFSSALVDQGTYRGILYSAPLGDSSTCLFYNVDLLKEAGIDIDWSKYDGDTRITYEELVEIAEDAVSRLDPDGTRGIYGIEIGQVGAVYQMNLFANSLGGKNISDDGTTVSGVIDTDAWKKAAKWYQDLVKKGVFSRGVSIGETYSNFYAGKCVFELMTADSYGYCLSGGMSEGSFGWTYQPAFEGYEGDVATGCGNWALGVSSFSKNKDAAGAFVKFMTYGEGNDIFLPLSGMGPNSDSRFTEELIAENPCLEIEKYEAAHTAVVRAVTPAFNEYSNALSTMWEDIRNGSDINKSISNAVKEVNSALASYQN